MHQFVLMSEEVLDRQTTAHEIWTLRLNETHLKPTLYNATIRPELTGLLQRKTVAQWR